MKYQSMAAFAAMSVLVGAQPSFAQGHSEGLELGNFYANCCGGSGDRASAQTLHIPQKGFAVELTAADPSCCYNTYAGTGVEQLNGFRLTKYIRFTLSGPGNTSANSANFGVYVLWTSHGTEDGDFFTVANGGLIHNGNLFRLNTNNHYHAIPPGSSLLEVDFELDGNCVSGQQVVDIQNVFLDNAFVNYELDHGTIENESAFCSGGCQ